MRAQSSLPGLQSPFPDLRPSTEVLGYYQPSLPDANRAHSFGIVIFFRVRNTDENESLPIFHPCDPCYPWSAFFWRREAVIFTSGARWRDADRGKRDKRGKEIHFAFCRVNNRARVFQTSSRFSHSPRNSRYNSLHGRRSPGRDRHAGTVKRQSP